MGKATEGPRSPSQSFLEPTQVGHAESRKSDEGRSFLCFVADIHPESHTSRPKRSPTLPPNLGHPRQLLQYAELSFWHAVLQLAHWEDALQLWGVRHQERGIVGAVVFDTLGCGAPLAITNGIRVNFM
jgi:hypothetical protein